MAYAKERFTFGRAIGSYQAVKHELVEILRRTDNARSLMYYAGWAAQDRPEEFPLAAVGLPARRRPGARPRGARADLRPRRDRRHLGARRAALLPPRAALAAPAGRRRAAPPTASRASCSPRRGPSAPRRAAAAKRAAGPARDARGEQHSERGTSRPPRPAARLERARDDGPPPLHHRLDRLARHLAASV